jgi:hypothetical protein
MKAVIQKRKGLDQWKDRNWYQERDYKRKVVLP